MSSVLINQEALREQFPHEYVGEPMPSIAAPNQKGTVGFTLLPLKLLSLCDILYKWCDHNSHRKANRQCRQKYTEPHSEEIMNNSDIYYSNG